MICPRCKKQLVYSDIDNHKIETCMHCHGIWLDKKQLSSMFPDEHGSLEFSSIDDNLLKDAYPQIDCRRCKGVKMKKVNFMGYSDIILDYCSECGGFWFDKGELEKIRVYMKKKEDGSHEVKYPSVYNFLVKLSEIAYSVFH